jgi:hypothetical protein
MRTTKNLDDRMCVISLGSKPPVLQVSSLLPSQDGGKCTRLENCTDPGTTRVFSPERIGASPVVMRFETDHVREISLAALEEVRRRKFIFAFNQKDGCLWPVLELRSWPGNVRL